MFSRGGLLSHDDNDDEKINLIIRLHDFTVILLDFFNENLTVLCVCNGYNNILIGTSTFPL